MKNIIFATCIVSIVVAIATGITGCSKPVTTPTKDEVIVELQDRLDLKQVSLTNEGESVYKGTGIDANGTTVQLAIRVEQETKEGSALEGTTIHYEIMDSNGQTVRSGFLVSLKSPAS